MGEPLLFKGSDFAATVTTRPFYDPEGKVLRS